MKKIILTFGIAFLALCNLQAQTEISGYLDATPNDGISGAAATFDLFSAVQACRNLVHDGKTDWYLPAWEEILLFTNGDSDTGTTPGCVGTNCDWTDSTYVWVRGPVRKGYNDGINTMFYILFKHATSGTNTNGGYAAQATSASGALVRCVR